MAVYLDHNATTPLAPEVISAVTESLARDWANPSSESVPGHQARQTIDTARQRVARLVNADCPEDIIFTSGGTESNNVAILSAVEWGQQHTLKPHVVLSNVEHVATSAPVVHLASQGRITYTEVEVNEDGCLNVDRVVSAIRPDTVLVTVMMANNETGVIFPIEDIGSALKKVNEGRKGRVWYHVDAAQAIGKLRVDVQALGVDYLTIVGHKFYGPRIGALYVRKVLSQRVVTPVVRGGGQESGLRPGTENTPMIAGLGAAAALVTDNLHRYTQHMLQSMEYLKQQLTSKLEVVVNCERSNRLPNTLSLSWPDCELSGHDILALCPRVIASTTAACHSQQQLSAVLLKSGVPTGLARTTIRLSVGRFTTTAELDVVVADLVKAVTSGVLPS